MLGMFAAVAVRAESAVAVIVPHARADARLAPEDLALIFQRKKLYWPDGSRIQPVNLPPTDPQRIVFSRALFGVDPVGLDDYWRERYFHGVRPPYVVASGEAMLRIVAETPNAVGYADACVIDERVVAVGFLDQDGHYRSSRPPISCQAPAAVAE